MTPGLRTPVAVVAGAVVVLETGGRVPVDVPAGGVVVVAGGVDSG